MFQVFLRYLRRKPVKNLNERNAEKSRTETGDNVRRVPVQPVREYKDRVFRMIFREPGRALELYNELNGTAYTDPDELVVTTLEHVIYLGMKNDMSFVLHDSLALYEHQSTKNPNLPLRNLFYVSSVYSKLTRNANLYSTKQVMIPAPQFLVFYNGKADMPERSVLKLSDAYWPGLAEPGLELETTVLNINPGYNSELLEKCRSLGDYMAFVNKTRAYSKQMGFAGAVEKAMDDCIRDGILADFFRMNRAEVASMSIFEYDAERHMQQEREEAFETGHQEGQIEERLKNEKQQLQKEIREILRLKELFSAEKIGEILEVERSWVEQVCHILEEYPDMTAEAIYSIRFPESDE